MDYGNSYKKASSGSGSSGGLTDKGIWDSAVSYAINDLVRYNNSLYKCILGITSGVPTNIANFATISFYNGYQASGATVGQVTDGDIDTSIGYGYSNQGFKFQWSSAVTLSKVRVYGYAAQGEIIKGISILDHTLTQVASVTQNISSTGDYIDIPISITDSIIYVVFLSTQSNDGKISEIQVFNGVTPLYPNSSPTFWTFFASALANSFLSPVTFAMNAPVADYRTVPYMVKNACAISEITILTDVVPTASMTFLLFKNGTQIKSITTDAVSLITPDISVALAVGDVLYAQISGNINGINFATIELNVV